MSKLIPVTIPPLVWAFIGTYGTTPATAAPREPKTQVAKSKPQKVVVHFSRSEGEEALHAALMGLGLATGLRKMGADVTVMLDSSGPNLAKLSWKDKALAPSGNHGMPNTKPRTLGVVFGEFTKAGGKIVMCPHCAMTCGVIQGSMLPGVRTGAEGELVKLVFNADKVLDY